MPSYGNPQSLNRYGYVLNNPLKYTDPTGHRACGEGEEFDCSGHKQDPNQNPHPPKPRKLPKPDESNENGNERTKDDIVTLPIPTFAPNQGSQPHGPNWTTTAATVAMVALGVVFIGLGVAMLVSGGFMVAAALPEVVALITGEAIGAAAAIDAVQGLIIGAAWYGGWGIAGISTGIKAIENGVTP